MTANDVLFAIQLIILSGMLLVNFVFKKEWLGYILLAFLFLVIGITPHQDIPRWMMVIYFPGVLISFTRAYFLYPSVFERLRSGDINLHRRLKSLLFDKKTIEKLEVEGQ